ncbi:hypothetical protein OG819_55325 [Streptomyces sp. NBC_01549]|uniref:hypothetical protein n=1 Tax=Streptomyces sp. NBC_01549 TaxID=2975874 RepID=UPI0022533A7C|nr:hypothetical protein [Streptomyces sp. NBC_01549]MCX4598330.1 hypothetical protein [Streptomyces sp. NBC_01549]
MTEPRRVEPYVWTWEEDGVSRQVNVHYTRIGTTVIYDPRHPGDQLPWFDADYERESDRGRWEDSDIVTLGPPDAPGYGLIEPDDDIDAGEDFSGVIDEVVSDSSPEQEGTRPMAITKIPDVVNHRALLNALNTIRAEVESRQEDVDNLANWSAEMAERMRGIGEELKALKLDTYTIGNVNMLGDLIDGSKKAADVYKNATDKSVTQAETAARTAHRNHGRIQDAVDDADVPMAQNTFYDAE